MRSSVKALEEHTTLIDQYLDVVPQEIVVIESCSADGWFLFEAGVWPMPVVLVVEV